MPDQADKPEAEKEAKPTTQIRVVSDRDLIEDTARTVHAMQDIMERLVLNVHTLMGDSHSLRSQIGSMDTRIAKLEIPSDPPPPAFTSTRARALIESHPSQIDLELAARQAEAMVKSQELERRISETATKADVQALTETTATKAEVKQLVEEAANAQTILITDAIKSIAKDPLFGKLIVAVVTAVIALLATCSKPPLAPAPQPPAPATAAP